MRRAAINKTASVIAALGAVVVTLLLPASAPTAEKPSAGVFTAEGTNGFSITVMAVPAYRGESAGVLIAARNERTGAGAAYATRAVVVTNTSIQADFGDLGEIDVTFRPSGVMRPVRSRCGRTTEPLDSGIYEGTIAFRGEQGYTEVEASSAGGDPGFLLDVICPGISGTAVSGADARRFFPGAQLEVEVGRGGEQADLKVVKNRPGARAHFEAGVSERRGRVAISRSTTTFLPQRAFLYDPLVRTATVRPPPPFAGVARFDRAAAPVNRWRGNLTVDLPGRSNVRLTGGAARATLMHARWDWSPGWLDGGRSSG